jgi:hypothetical protein
LASFLPFLLLALVKLLSEQLLDQRSAQVRAIFRDRV